MQFIFPPDQLPGPGLVFQLYAGCSPGNMSPLTPLTPFFLLLGLSCGAPMGSYQGEYVSLLVCFSSCRGHPLTPSKHSDSLAKYSKWIEKFGEKGRAPRKTDLNHLIFVPHR